MITTFFIKELLNIRYNPLNCELAQAEANVKLKNISTFKWKFFGHPTEL